MNWSSFLDNAKAVAEKAKQAAVVLEGQLNESVGVSQDASHTVGTVRKSAPIFPTAPDEDDNDSIGEDVSYNSDDDFDVAMHDKDNSGSSETCDQGETDDVEQSNQENIDVETTSDKVKDGMIRGSNEKEADIPDFDKNLAQKDFICQNDEIEETREEVEDLLIHTEVLNPDSTVFLKQNSELDIGYVVEDKEIIKVSPVQDVQDNPSIPVAEEKKTIHFVENDTDNHETTSSNVSKGEYLLEPSNYNQKLFDLEAALSEARETIRRQEEQMVEKDQQISQIIECHKLDKKALELKVKETKDEAKKRVASAKEKVESLKSQLAKIEFRTENSDESSKEKDEIIAALRNEGEKLAIKQSNMEQLIKDARWDIKNLKDELEREKNTRNAAEKKIIDLEIELKGTKETLSAAQAKGGLVEKLDYDLLAAKEEKEKHSSMLSKLENELKAARAANLVLQKETDAKLEDMLHRMESQIAATTKEKEKMLNDLEIKLNTVEREASLREDSLRQEVSELRKRWQESVRRCDALNMDLQQSCGPLLRQLESAERQSRSKAMAWAELECKLRSELEGALANLEAITNEKKKLEIDLSTCHRDLRGQESEFEMTKIRLEEASTHIIDAKKKYDTLFNDFEDIKVKCSMLEHRQKDNESKIRSEMTMTMRDSEERYNEHIDTLEIELRQERERRQCLENQIKEIAERAKTSNADQSRMFLNNPERSLGRTDAQASILHSTILTLGNTDKNDFFEFVGNDYSNLHHNSNNSFAFMEQMSQSLSSKESELETLRAQVNESETLRSVLENELALCRERLIYKDTEIQSLEEDILDARRMFRSQLALMGHQQDGVMSTSSATLEKPSTSFLGMRTF